MDIDGSKGGIWRTAATLFQDRGLAATHGQYQFSVPNCGALARDVAIRIVATNKAANSRVDTACYFTMNPLAIIIPTTTSNVVVPTTTAAPPPDITTVAPPVSSGVTTGTPTTIATTATIPSSGTSTATQTSSTSGTSLTSIPNPSNIPFPPLPPLPPLDDPSSTSDGSGSTQGNTPGNGPVKDGPGRTIGVALGGVSGMLALVLLVTLFIVRRRRHTRSREPGLLGGSKGGGQYGGLGMKEKLMMKGRRLKGSNKGQSERDFYLMRDDDDDDDYNDNASETYDSEVAAAVAKHKKRHTLADPEAGSSEKQSSEADKQGEATEPSMRGHDRDSTLSYPPNAYIDRYLSPSGSHQYMYTDDESTMSSMRSSFESSSVVRQYWAASMAARTERRLEGFPPSVSYSEGDSVFGGHRRTPSMSSQSRKADILSMDDSSFTESYIDGPRVGAGAGSAAGPLSFKEGMVKRHYRSTVNSVQSYIRRSMSMSLASFQSGISSTDDEGWHRGHGYRSSINTEFLDHLNIKALRSHQHQLAYYRHYYRQNPSLTASTIDETPVMGANAKTMTTTTSWRTSSAPSLTSTNDPFQTFDSNEILVDLSPFSDLHAVQTKDNEMDQTLQPPPKLSVVTAEDRSNSSLLRSFPSPPLLEPAASPTDSKVSSARTSAISSLQLNDPPRSPR
ncbi:hypothetical protein BGZ54_001325 [Gamsiella multidivaricata]|nr:hypothetical protein BGZ54_001325 [Gamsiella multidivaricata]